MTARISAARPEIDWTVDSELPSRFKQWRRHVSNEIRLLMAEDPNKKEEWACTFAASLLSALESKEKTSFNRLECWVRRTILVSF